jgi:large subunit ribosomal protein L9
LFGTITTKKLAEELLAVAGIEIDRKTVTLSAPINKVGEYKMTIKLTSKVKAELAVIVTASEVLQESIEEEVEEVAAEETTEA